MLVLIKFILLYRSKSSFIKYSVNHLILISIPLNHIDQSMFKLLCLFMLELIKCLLLYRSTSVWYRERQNSTRSSSFRSELLNAFEYLNAWMLKLLNFDTLLFNDKSNLKFNIVSCWNIIFEYLITWTHLNTLEFFNLCS